jgi:hypothetical protein
MLLGLGIDVVVGLRLRRGVGAGDLAPPRLPMARLSSRDPIGRAAAVRQLRSGQ